MLYIFSSTIAACRSVSLEAVVPLDPELLLVFVLEWLGRELADECAEGGLQGTVASSGCVAGMVATGIILLASALEAGIWLG